jgi:hypothetical protein
LDTAAYNSIVDQNKNWFSNSNNHILNYYFYTGGNYYISGLFKPNDKYLCFRHILPTDTIYGWFLINAISNIAIRSWAYTVAAVGVKSKNADYRGITIYPNPSSNILNINPHNNTFQKSEIEITNTLGKHILNISFSQKIDITNLAPGIYFLKITSQNEQIYQYKFIKE